MGGEKGGGYHKSFVERGALSCGFVRGHATQRLRTGSVAVGVNAAPIAHATGGWHATHTGGRCGGAYYERTCPHVASSFTTNRSFSTCTISPLDAARPPANLCEIRRGTSSRRPVVLMSIAYPALREDRADDALAAFAALASAARCCILRSWTRSVVARCIAFVMNGW